jgi:hypothetical protein
MVAKDIVESVVSDAKKFEDTNDPAIILDVKGSTKPVVEETAAIHSKDITAVSNVSEAATLVATYVRRADAGYMLYLWTLTPGLVLLRMLKIP